MPEQAEQSRNDYLALISRLENADTDEAKGVKPVGHGMVLTGIHLSLK